MKQLIITLLALFCLSASAQNIKNKYSFRSNDEGNIYFIHPLEGFECKTLKKDNKLVFDATYLSTTDSVTYNFTYFNELASPADSVFIQTVNGGDTSVDCSMIFIKPYKKIWEQRASLKMSNAFFTEIYHNEAPYKIKVYSKGREYTYTINAKNWEKQSGIVNKILEVIKYSNQISK